jgi:glycine/D-amino acid oxidase-like deaminating enzyme
MENSRGFDVVIIGGGIVGCATAYYLAKRKLRVAIIERGSIASEQSSRAWGFVRQQGRHRAEVPLAAESSRIWAGLAGELQADLEFVRGGILVPAETSEDEDRLKKGAEIAAAHGLTTRMVSAKEIKTVIPELAGHWRSALYTAEDGHAEPRKTTEAFAAAAERYGAKLHCNTRAIGIEVTNGRATGVVTPNGTIGGDAVLCAAGLGSRIIAAQFGIKLPIQGIRAHVSETNPARPFSRTAVWAPRTAFRPTQRGTFYIGTGYRVTGVDYDVTLSALSSVSYFLPMLGQDWKHINLCVGYEFLEDLRQLVGIAPRGRPWREPHVNRKVIEYSLNRFYEMLPGVRGLGISRCWAGRIDMTPDLLPIVGEAESVKGFFVATGYSGHGFALGPVTGRLLSQLIADGRPSLDLRPFRISRFAEGEIDRSPDAL